MTKEQELLLDILKNALFDAPLSLAPETDFAPILKEAKEQTVLPLVAAALQTKNTTGYQSLVHYIQVVHEQSMLIKLFEENSVPLVILKGTAAAMYYPKPHLRTMGDVDFIVPVEKFEEARKILEENRYVFRQDFGDDRDYEYTKGGVILELHRRFSNHPGVEQRIKNGIEHAVRCSVNGYEFPCLPPTENGLAILDHIRHHFKSSGLGLRHLLDWMMFAHTVLDDKVWAEQFQPIAKETGLERLAVVLTATCRKWLGLPEDYGWSRHVEDDLADQTIETFLTNGNFGRKLVREDHKVEDATIAVKREGLFRFLQSTGELTWTALEKHPWLRPFAWLYQSCRYISRGVKALSRGENFRKQVAHGKVKGDFYNRLGI